jgi:predicted phage terminase large subunit-like protein
MFYPGYQASRFHELLAMKLEDCLRRKVKRLILNVPPQHGKQLDDDTPVMTPKGWVRHGDLRVGDEVYHPDGKAVAVVGVTEPTMSDMEVEFTNGAKIVAHENHEWRVYDRTGKPCWKTVETKYLASRKLISGGLKGQRGSRCIMQVPERAPIAGKSRKLSVHPYLLGVWLGDGRTSNPDFCYATADIGVYERVLSLGFKPTWQSVHRDTGVNYVGFAAALRTPLKSMGLIGCKHIPMDYLLASEKQRMQLLAGLIDTDGSTDPNNGRIRFVTCSARLRDDFCDLIRTLGWEPSVWTAEPCTSSSGVIGRQPVHYVAFQPDRAIPCALARKAKLTVAKKRRIGIVAVRKVAPRPGRCIQVDREDGLYLAGRELIPTHNSVTASVMFPAWALTKFPTLRFFQAGHTGDLSKGFSREARNAVMSDRYLSYYPELVNKRVNRENFWKTNLGGYYYATSVGGGTGVPADILIIDDPHADRQSANSQNKRDRVWDWFTSTAMTRLAPDGVVIIIQTRWHRDDLSGRLQDGKRTRALAMAGFGHVNYEVIEIQAECENPATDLLGRKMGEALWPEQRDAKWLAAQKMEITAAEWNALYQQRPNPPGGLLVDVTKIKTIRLDQVPHGLRKLRGWDLALSTDTIADFSCGARACMDANKNFYLLDMDRKKRAWLEQKSRIVTLARREVADGVITVEAVSAFKIGTAELRSELSGAMMVKEFTPSIDKVSRAMEWMPKIDGGQFYMVEGDWNAEFVDELEQFPNGTHDDQIDAVTVAHAALKNSRRLVMA